jgi:hypothetical protein
MLQELEQKRQALLEDLKNALQECTKTDYAVQEYMTSIVDRRLIIEGSFDADTYEQKIKEERATSDDLFNSAMEANNKRKSIEKELENLKKLYKNEKEILDLQEKNKKLQ